MTQFRSCIVLAFIASLTLVDQTAADFQKCGIDEYFQRDLEMCKPCTEVCRPVDRFCGKLCPCYVVLKKLEQLNVSDTLLQKQYSELATTKERWRTNATATQEKLGDAEINITLLQKKISYLTARRNGWRLAAVAMVVIVLLLITARIVVWKLGIFKNARHRVQLQPAEENNVPSKMVTNGAPPSPDVVPMTANGYFHMECVRSEEGREEERDAGQGGETSLKGQHSSNGQETSAVTECTYIPATPSIRNEAYGKE